MYRLVTVCRGTCCIGKHILFAPLCEFLVDLSGVVNVGTEGPAGSFGHCFPAPLPAFLLPEMASLHNSIKVIVLRGVDWGAVLSSFKAGPMSYVLSTGQ